MKIDKGKPPVRLADAGLHALLTKACSVAKVDVPPFAQDGFYVAALARRFKVKCPDCGHYPGERIDLGNGYKMQELTPELEAKLKNKCGRCHKGIDDNHDGDCVVCAHLTDAEIARLNEPDSRWEWIVKELPGGEGVEVQRDLIGPVQTALPPPINYMNHDAVLNHTKKIAGRILTVIDASFPEGTQRDALKSLIRREFRAELERIGDFFDGPNTSREGYIELKSEL